MFGRYCLFLAFALVLLATRASAEPVRVEPGIESLRLSNAARYLIDPQGTLDLVAIQHDDTHWQTVQSAFPSFGFTRDTLWLKLELHNAAPQQSDYVLQVEYPLLDHVAFFYPDASTTDASDYRSIITGDQKPFHERVLRDRHFSFPLHVPLNQSVTVYLRLQSTDTLIAPLTLFTKSAYEDAQRIETMFFGMYYGAIIAILFINSFLFFFLRQKAQIFFVALLATYGLMELSLNGTGMVFVWGDHPVLAKQIRPFVIGCLAILSMQLTKAYFGARSIRLLGWNLEYGVWAMGLAAIAATFILPFTWAIRVAMLAIVAAIPVIIAIGIKELRLQHSAARYFMFGWSGVMVGGALNILRAFDLLPVNFITTYGSQIGSLTTLLILYMGLTDQFRSTQRLRELEQERELRHTEAMNRQLDQAVQERTRELQEKNAEAERARAVAEQALLVKSQFLATMSHEIRTPMNGVLGITQMLTDTPLNPHQRHLVNTIRNSGNALVAIINDVLDFSKIEAGKLTLENIRFPLRNLLDECVALFASATDNRPVRLILHVTPKVPFHIHGDPTRLRQAIMNLVGNALKFTAQGHVILQADFDTEQQQLRISVIDTGIGISAEQQEKLFQSFSQADSSTTRKYGGTGLGLAICRSLVQLMHGNITVHSAPGTGSTFTLTIPCPASNPARTVPALTGKVILIADPLPAFCTALADMLRAGGCVPHIIDPDNPAAPLPPRIDAAILSQHLPRGQYSQWQQRLRCPLILVQKQDANLPRDPRQLAEPVTQESLRLHLLELFSGQERPAIAGTQSPVFSDVRVLVAEDNPVNQMVIRGLLKKFGIVPDIANDGLEAIHAAQSADTPFDLILMDCEMPNLDGYQATRQLIQLPACRHTRIVGLSAHAMAEHRDAGLQAGMLAFLTKPVSVEALEQQLAIASRSKPN